MHTRSRHNTHVSSRCIETRTVSTQRPAFCTTHSCYSRTTGINVVASETSAGLLPVAAYDGRSLLANEVQWIHDVLSHTQKQWGLARASTDHDAKMQEPSPMAETPVAHTPTSPLALLNPVIWTVSAVRRAMSPFTITSAHIVEPPVSMNDQRWEMVLRAQIMHFLQRGGVVLNNLDTLRALRRMAEQQGPAQTHQG